MDLIINQWKKQNNLIIENDKDLNEVNKDSNEVDKVLLALTQEEPNKCEKKNYLKQFKIKHKDTIKQKIECPICSSTYSYVNKSKHLKTKRHLKMDEIQKNKK